MRRTRLERTSLPHQVTSFIGRRSETVSIKRELEDTRLLCLTGPGGVGKTRLALQLAANVGPAFADGIYFVELAEVQDPDRVAHSIAVALDLQDARSPEIALLGFLSDKQLLIVLDNCEHVLDSTAHIVAEILASAANITILATSREPLAIQGERVWPVSPLSIPPADPEGAGSGDLSQRFESVALFVERARSVARNFELTADNAASVAGICTRLDGLPLAIELAAGRLRALSPEQILERLEHRFDLLTGGNRAGHERQQTLQAAIAWSYDLCPPAERTVWSRCSAFAGEFEVNAAEYVCSDESLSEADVFAAVAGLVDKSILISVESGSIVRYRMLETIRQFGDTELAKSGVEPVVRRKHRDYYLKLADQCDMESSSDQQAVWAARLPADRPNLLASLDYSLKTPGEEHLGLHMAAALWFNWIACGLVRDARYWLDAALAANPQPTHERARALWVAGWARVLNGDNYAGVELLGECHRTATKLRDEVAVAHATQLIGLAKTFHNEREGALALLDRAIEMHRRRESWTGPALMSLIQRSFTAAILGDVSGALNMTDELSTICVQQGELWAFSWVPFVRAVAAWVSTDIVSAAEEARQGHSQKLDLDDQLGIPACIEILAWCSTREGRYDRAALLFGHADKMWEKTGTPLFGDETLLQWSTECRELARASLGAQRYDASVGRATHLTESEVADLISGGTAVEANEDKSEDTGTRTPLTKREREVAKLVATGMSNRDIAAALVISQRTAEAHVEHILTKLDLTSRTQIAAWIHASALQEGRGEH